MDYSKLKKKEITLEDSLSLITKYKKFMLNEVTHSIEALKYTSDTIQDDYDVVLASVKKYGSTLQYASDRLRDNDNIVLTAIHNYAFSIRYASERLKHDDSIVLAAIKNNGNSLKYVSKSLQNDRDIVLEAMKQNCHSLTYASNDLQNNKELLKILEKEDVSDWFSDDKEWYDERMEVLANMRKQEEKKIMENAIIKSSIKSKKIKF